MALKRIKYVGPHPEVEFQDGLGEWRTVKRHGHVDLPTALANNMAEQEENWQIVDPAPAADEKGKG